MISEVRVSVPFVVNDIFKCAHYRLRVQSFKVQVYTRTLGYQNFYVVRLIHGEGHPDQGYALPNSFLHAEKTAMRPDCFHVLVIWKRKHINKWQ